MCLRVCVLSASMCQLCPRKRGPSAKATAAAVAAAGEVSARSRGEQSVREGCSATKREVVMNLQVKCFLYFFCKFACECKELLSHSQDSCMFTDCMISHHHSLLLLLPALTCPTASCVAPAGIRG